jgi:hypothetical protein
MVKESTTSNPPSSKKHMPHRRKQIYLQIIVAIIILSCGIVIGSGVTLLRLKDRVVMRGPRPPLIAIVEDIQTRYDLTPEQTEQAEDILGKSRETLHTLFEEFRQRTEAEFQKISIEMKEVLSPEQYERWENDFRSRRERGPGRFGPGRPGPGRFGPERRGPRRFGPGRPDPNRPSPGKPGPGRSDLCEPRLPEPNATPE